MVNEFGTNPEKMLDMKKNNITNVNIFIKKNIDILFIVFNLLLSVIGFFSAIAAAKNELYENPFLFALPLSSLFWILFGVFYKLPERNYTETNSIQKLRNIPFVFVFIVKLFLYMIFSIFILIIFSNFAFIIIFALKEVVSPLFSS